MGTAIETEIAAYEPSAVSWPAEDGQLYTLVSFGTLRSICVVRLPGREWPAAGQAPRIVGGASSFQICLFRSVITN